MSDFDGDYTHPGPSGAETYSAQALARCVREVADHVDAGGWGQPPQMFALVPTAALAAAEPDLLDQLEDGAELTPVEQEPFPEDVGGGSPALDEFLATTSWPAGVVGCVLVQEIVVLPPDAASALDSAVAPVLADEHAADEMARATAGAHPERRDARLIAAVLRDGPSACVLALKPDEDDPDAEPELLTHEDLAPNLVNALYATFDVTDDDW
ncbi:PPA1309 family protein [Rhodococcus olei]|uniref:PPA1309 family protein n=1 Tax=Rhodococcus olei TaxID=2161675 RepID=A0ABP8P199_9NOCA